MMKTSEQPGRRHVSSTYAQMSLAPDPKDGWSAPRKPSDVDRMIGERIRLLRGVRKLTQRDLADAFGVTFQQLQNYERGANRVAAGRLALIAEALGVYPSDLLGSAADASADSFDVSPEASAIARAFDQIPEGSVKARLRASIMAGLAHAAK